ALRHALAAGDRDYVTTVLVDHWPCIVLCLGDHGVGTEVPPPPEGALREAPDLALAYAADRLSQDDAVGADHYLRLAAAHEHHIGSERRMRFGLILTAFQLAHARLRGDPTRVMSTARRLLALGTDTDGDADEPDQHLRARTTALASLGAAQLASGDLVSAERSLSAGLDAAELARLPCVRLSCGARLAVAQAGLGALGQAERAARAALRAPPCRGRCGELCGGYAYLALAVVHYEWDRLSDAGRYLDLAAACCRGAADPFVITGIAIVRTSVLQAQGDLHAAYNALRVAHRDPTTATTRYLCDGLTIAEANVRICAGDTAAARALLTPMLDGATAPPAALAVPLGRAYLRDGNPAAATAVLPGWADDEAAAGPLALRLEAGLLSALAAHRNGDAHRASHAMERVLVLARPEGFRRPFTRAGSPVRRLLADQLDAGTAHWAMVLDLLGAATTDPAGTARQVTLEEPLTDRELTVLRHLQGVRSNMEIASNLSLSVNTIKTHIRSIYRKLRVTGRREAITKARELDLV
ncbi:MAG: LuxR family transcriptional regulator, maltose regulon positive regulatory protein, partial [Blastocatellia bacterium]|nr:LuxR family transcriptional regulator, maltose regulon positive regulatory protein [Blastocatellia bacterium]